MDKRFVVKVTPVNEMHFNFAYVTKNGARWGGQFKEQTKESLQSDAFNSEDEALNGYRSYLAGNSQMCAALVGSAWWREREDLSDKEKEGIDFLQYDLAKDRYIYEIMTVDDAWDDWRTRMER